MTATRDVVLDAGGAAVGAVVTLTTTDGRRVTWSYVTDPEGNIIELQSWSAPDAGPRQEPDADAHGAGRSVRTPG